VEYRRAACTISGTIASRAPAVSGKINFGQTRRPSTWEIPMNPTESLVSESTRQLNAEWDELAALHPAPTLDDVRPEWLWVREHMEDGSIDPDNRYAGLHVAVYQQRVVGADTNPSRLRVRLSRELNIHPERLVVVFLNEI
jgi:hypothetical protein